MDSGMEAVNLKEDPRFEWVKFLEENMLGQNKMYAFVARAIKETDARWLWEYIRNWEEEHDAIDPNYRPTLTRSESRTSDWNPNSNKFSSNVQKRESFIVLFAIDDEHIVQFKLEHT